MNKTKRLTMLAFFLAVSIVLHLIEPNIPIPVVGVKLGLANIIGLVVLFRFGKKDMIAINLQRVLLSSLLRGMIFGTAFWLSLSGVTLSTVMTILCARKKDMSILFLSVISAIFHCIGQILAAMLIYQNVHLLYWLPAMLACSVPTGILTGVLAQQTLKRVRNQ